jgi:hypothetical protein
MFAPFSITLVVNKILKYFQSQKNTLFQDFSEIIENGHF